MLQSPYFGINYGWPYGADGWNSGMDYNLVRLAFLNKHSVDEFVSSLPATAPEGYSCILTTDNTAYFWVEGRFSFVDIELGYEFTTLKDGRLWRRTVAGYEEVPSNDSISDRTTSLEGRADANDIDISAIQQNISELNSSVSGVSHLQVTSQQNTMSLASWMIHVRDRVNHTGTQESSTISDFEETSISVISDAITSDSLDITTSDTQIRIENDNSLGSEVGVVGGQLNIPLGGGYLVPLQENVSDISLPEEKQGKTVYVSIVFVQGSEDFYTVTGWPEGVVWDGGAEPEIDYTESSSTIVELVNINAGGWVGRCVNYGLAAKADKASLSLIATTGAAINVTLEDNGEYFESEQLEGVLQEIGASLDTLGGTVDDLNSDASRLSEEIVTEGDTLLIPNAGSVVIDLVGDVTSVELPTGGAPTKRLTVLFRQAGSTPHTVSGWDSSVRWKGGVEPVIEQGVGAEAVVELVSMGELGWVASYSSLSESTIDEGEP